MRLGLGLAVIGGLFWLAGKPEEMYAQTEGEPIGQMPDELEELLGGAEAEVFRLFDELDTAMQEDPNSPRVAELEAQLEAAMDRLNDRFEAAEEELEGLPAAPVESPGRPGREEREDRGLEALGTEEGEDRGLEALGTEEGQERAPIRTAPAPLEQAPVRPERVEPAAPEREGRGEDRGLEALGTEEPQQGPAPDVEDGGPEPVVVDPEEEPRTEIEELADDGDPDALVRLRTSENILELSVLLEYVGKELGVNFLYEDTQPVQGEVLLQSYGEIRRRDLLPLLETVLAFHNYVMIKEGAFVRIRQRDPALLQRAEPRIVVGKEMAELGPTETVVAQIVPIEHARPAEVMNLLRQFVSDTNAIRPIPNTNYLIIVEYTNRMPRLLEMVRLVDQPGPQRRLEVVQVEHLTAQAAQSHVNALLRALADQGATVEAAPEPVRPTARPPRPPLPEGAPGAEEPAMVEEPMAGVPTATGATLYVDERTNRLLVIGTDVQIAQVKELLAILDVEQPGPEIVLEPVMVTNIPAGEAADRIESLLTSLREQSQVEQPVPGRGGGAEPARPSPRPTRSPREEAAPPTAAGGSSVSRVTEKPPVIHVDERTNRLLVVGTRAQVEDIEELLLLIDVVAGPEIRLSVIELEYVEADEVVGQVESLIAALTEQGAGSTAPARGGEAAPSQQASQVAQQSPQERAEAMRQERERQAAQQRGGERREEVGPQGPAIFSDTRTNRLLVVGSDEQIEQVHELLEVLDVPEGPEIKLEVVRVEHVLVGDVAGQIRDLMEALTEQGARLGGAGEVQGQRPTQQAQQQQQQQRQQGPQRPGQEQAFTDQDRSAGAALFTDERTNRLLIVGSEEQIGQVKGLLSLLDVREGPEIKLAAIQVEHVLAEDVASQLSELLGALIEKGGEIQPGAGRGGGVSQPTVSGPVGEEQQRPARERAQSQRGQGTQGETGPGPFIMVDSRTNRLLVVGSEEQLKQLTELLAVLDVPPSQYDRQFLRVYQPQYVEATEVERILEQLGIMEEAEESARDAARGGRGEQAPARPFGGMTEGAMAAAEEGGLLLPGQGEPQIRIAVQETTNKLFVLATDYQHADIAEIVRQVDVELPDAAGAIQIYTLENRDPEDVATMLQDLLETEREAQEEAGGVERIVTIPGREGAPIVVSLPEIYAVAVRASQKQHEEIAGIIDVLDKRLPSVLLEAILVQVTTDDVLNLGVSLQNAWAVDADEGKRISGTSPFGFSVTRGDEVVTGLGGTIAFFDEDFVYATLEAMQTDGKSRVTSMPRVLVNDNEQGAISNRRQEPTTRTTIPAGSDTPIIEFREYVDAGTTLAITPHISEGNFLKLEIQLDVDSFDGRGSGNVPPPKSVNNVTTIVNVPDGKYIVLGGLTTRTENTTVNKVPLLGDIPLLGLAFRSVTKSDAEAVLYIFVKADIVRDENFADLDHISEKYRQRLRQSEKDYREQQDVIPGIDLPQPDEGTRWPIFEE